MTLRSASPALRLFTQFDDSCFGAGSEQPKPLTSSKTVSNSIPFGINETDKPKNETFLTSGSSIQAGRITSENDMKIRKDNSWLIQSSFTCEVSPEKVPKKRLPPKQPGSQHPIVPRPRVTRIPSNDLSTGFPGLNDTKLPSKLSVNNTLPTEPSLLLELDLELRLPLPVMQRSLYWDRRFSEQLLPDRLLGECMSLSDHLDVYTIHLNEVAQSLVDILEDECDTIVRDLYRCITEIESSVPYNTIVIARAQSWAWR